MPLTRHNASKHRELEKYNGPNPISRFDSSPSTFSEESNSSPRIPLPPFTLDPSSD
ncbi:MAG: hypothetical protein HEEMFOPI_00828 [Holosporales bacterium]